MQDKKEYQEKLFAHFQLSERIATDNFYRRLKGGTTFRFFISLNETLLWAKWSKEQDQRTGAGNKGGRYTSNKTHYSPTDPNARISVKPGKARKLNYMSHLSVDTAHHVITDIKAYHADKKDNQYL